MSAPSRTRLLIGVIGLLLIMGVTVSAGRWQLSRADEKRALVARIELGRTLPPLTLSPTLATADMAEWRGARARGKWLPDFTVLVENRNHQGQPGFWVISPLQFDPPTGSQSGPAEVVAVLASPAVTSKLDAQGFTPKPMAPDAFRKFIQDETVKFADLIKTNHITLD